MARALDIETGSSITKLILLKLCDNANDQGECWPSQEGIAKQCETTRETVNRHIKKLVNKGLIEKVDQYKKGVQTVSKYMINLGVTENHTRCDGGSHQGVTEDHTEPIIEPTIDIKNIQKDFETFWNEYPKKINKGNARKTFEKVIKTVSIDELLNGIKKSPQLQREKQYIPNPQAWLNSEGWLDECTDPSKSIPAPEDFHNLPNREKTAILHDILNGVRK